MAGHYKLSLFGDADAFRVWPDASGTHAAPLLSGGQTVTNGAGGVTFLSGDDTDLYVEAVSNGTATLIYSYAGTGDAEGISCSAALKMTALGITISPHGQVTFTNSTVNVAFHLSSGCWTNCVWTITSGTARFADGPTESGTDLTSQGTNVWVSPGTLATNYSITCCALAEPTCQDVAGLVISKDIAWTPCGKHIYVWAPIAEMAFSFGFIDELVDPNFYQGWSYSMTNPVTWFSDPDPADDDFGTCTLANLKAMSNGGIVAVLTHGQIGQVEIARCATEAAAMAWKSSEADMVAVPGPLPATNYWSVIAFPAWFSRCWKPSLDQRKTIVFLEVCYSSDGYPSIASSVGGQTVFSSYGSAEGATTDAAFLDVIDKMHTTVATPNKSRRVAASAFSASSVLTQNAISLLGDGLSTLCPAPQTVFPASPVEARSGWGCILFDSYMDSSVSADTAVILTAGTVGTRSWGGNGQGHFYVSFPHAGPASVEAVGGVCRSKGGTIGRPLDGDAAVPMPENGQSKEWGW